MIKPFHYDGYVIFDIDQVKQVELLNQTHEAVWIEYYGWKGGEKFLFDSRDDAKRFIRALGERIENEKDCKCPKS